MERHDLESRVREALKLRDSDRLAALLDDAVNRGEVEEVRFLLDVGIDPNIRDCAGDTPLMNAAWIGSPELVALLIKRGADVHARGQDQATALERVEVLKEGRHEGHDAVAKLLRTSLVARRLKLNPSRVPSGLRPLIPWAERWGVGDDVEREQLILDASTADLEALVRSIDGVSDDALYGWLAGPDAHNKQPSDEYLAITNLTMAIDSAKVKLKRRK
jgi:hypothetical protein